jgi:polysaccharide biosynthesis PFTS motif protein
MRAFVSYADYGLRHVARNILLGKEGVQTWYYSDAEGVFDTMPGPQYRDKLFGYMFFDHVVTWSGRFARYLQRHNQVVGHYHVVGGIWSEHVRMIREGRLNTNLPERLRAHGWRSGLKLIGAFDSGLMDDTLITQADGVAFARDLFRLLADLPDVCLLWKEKKTPEQQRDMGNEALVALYEEMKRHPRCYFTGVATSPSEVMAVSDLCIGFCYGSPVTEALGAGVKAIYHDPDKKYAGGYYDRVPGLVTHDYDALRRRVSDLLYRTTDAEYRMFLDTQVKGDIDPCLDGLGLTRFRELLMVGEP